MPRHLGAGRASDRRAHQDVRDDPRARRAGPVARHVRTGRLRAADDHRRQPRLPVRVRTRCRRVDVCDHMRAAPDRFAATGRIRAAARPRRLERREGRAAGQLRRSTGGASLGARCADRLRASGRVDRRPMDDPGGGAVRAVAGLAARAGDAMLYLTIIGGVFIAWLILAVLFTPHVPYHIEAEIDARSDHFIHVIESTCSTHLEPDNRIDILTNGDRFYPAMLAAIRAASETINMECYIFEKGEIE